MILWDIFVWAVMAYLIGTVAYNKGRKDKWEEMCREYICIHKSVCVQKVQKRRKTLDKSNKKR